MPTQLAELERDALARDASTAGAARARLVVLESVREHLMQVGNETMVLCVATWREKEVAVAACDGSTPTRDHDAAPTGNGDASQPARR
jgi:hypothetical protein